MRHRRGSAVALVAACVIAFQYFLGAWTTGAMAAPRLDTFGNPLCITGTGHGGKTPATDHQKFPDCCTLGCSFTSQLLAAGPGDGIDLGRPHSSDEICSGPVAVLHIQPPDHDPGIPRAPPATV